MTLFTLKKKQKINNFFFTLSFQRKLIGLFLILAECSNNFENQQNF